MFNRIIKHYIFSLRYLSFKKFFYLIFAEFNFHFGRGNLNKYMQPVFISVEPADFCQLRCPECPVGKAARNKGSLANDQVIFDTIAELRNSLLHIIFYFQGEPLLNPRLNKYIQCAHNAGIYTSTSTNAMLLHSENARKMVESGLDKLIVSVDGATQEVYEQYRRGGNLQRALDGIKYIQYWKKKLKSQTPFVEMQFIVFGTNEHQITDIKNIASKVGADALKLKSAQIYDFENPNPLHTSLSRHSRYKKSQNGTYTLKTKISNKCRRVIRGSVLNAKGEVLPCCFDKDSSFSYGNVNESDFMTSWQSVKAQSFRKAVYKNRKQFEICRNCTEK
jgi:radical SAM protein with 4Fe4S-binding SPASM domain